MEAKRAKRQADPADADADADVHGKPAPRSLDLLRVSSSSEEEEEEEELMPLSQTDNARPTSASGKPAAGLAAATGRRTSSALGRTSSAAAAQPPPATAASPSTTTSITSAAAPSTAVKSTLSRVASSSALNAAADRVDDEELLAQPWPPASALARTIHDRIHGHITFEPVLVAVIDTPEFQRLRDLKQLGGTVYVYPGACHTRFEHCLGVSHLAGLMVEHLIQQEGNAYEIDERDRLCLKLAGLCHDLGHGPFSHMFELFVNRVRDLEGKPHWEHEDASMQLLDHLLATNTINLEAYGLKLPEDIAFVKLCISGLRTDAPWPAAEIGRPDTKRFLLDIVANKRNGIDVDKLGM